MKADDIPPPPLEKGLYHHSKTGNIYEVLGVALHSETSEFLVVYRAKYASNYELFVRPYDMFVELVEVDGETVPRFRKVDSLQSFTA